MAKDAKISLVPDPADVPATITPPIAPDAITTPPVATPELTPKQRIAAAFAELSAQGVTPYLQRQFDDFLNIIMRDYQ